MKMGCPTTLRTSPVAVGMRLAAAACHCLDALASCRAMALPATSLVRHIVTVQRACATAACGALSGAACGGLRFVCNLSPDALATSTGIF